MLALFLTALFVLLTAALSEAHPLDTLAPGQWYMAPNTKLRPICPTPPPVGSCQAIMNAWSGGAYDSKRDRLIIWGGGHGDYWGNELDVFDVASLSWSRAWGPSPNATIQNNGTDLMIDEVNGDGLLVGNNITGTTYIDLNLSPSTRYTYQVVAVDTLGKRSRISSSITIRTPAANGTVVNSTGPLSTSTVTSDPAMVLALAGTTNSSTSVSLTWSASTGTSPIAYYQVYRDASPVSRHTYGSPQYLPLLDRFWASGGALQGGSGGGGQATWQFDFDAGKWTRVGATDKPGNDTPASAYDSQTGNIWSMLGSTLYEYNVTTGVWTNRQVEGSSAYINSGAAALDPTNRIFMHVGDGQAYMVSMTGPPPWPRKKITPGQACSPTCPPMLTGDTEIITGQVAQGLYNRPGIEYDSIGQRFVLWVGGVNVYVIDPLTLVVTKILPSASNTVIPTQGPTAGTYGRWRYVPKWDVYIAVNSIDENVYFYKPIREATLPVCGNAIVETGEQCDLGTALNGPCPATCSSTCTVNACPPTTYPVTITPIGGGVGCFTGAGNYAAGTLVTLGAQVSGGTLTWSGDSLCTTGSFTMPARAVACQASTILAPPVCTVAPIQVCNNGVREGTEACDNGAANGPCPAACSTSCQINSCPPPTGVIDIPARQWVGLTLPANPPSGLPGVIKHTMPSYNPENGRIYFTGGDFGSTPGTSYRQDSYSLSLAERWIDRANVNAGWRQEYAFCGPIGGVQPKHPDYVGFPWDSKRKVFWFVPGLMEAWGGGECPGESGGTVSDPGFNHDKVMTFDPAVQKWAVQPADYFGKSGNANADMGWGVVYDAQTDSLIRLTGDLVDTLDLATQIWTRTQIGLAGQPPGMNQSGGTLRLGNGYAALDPVSRVIYSIDPNESSNWGALYRYKLGTAIVESMGPLPMNYGLSAAYEGQFKLVWDTKNSILYWNSHMPGGFFAFHPDTKTWESLGTTTNIPGVQAVNSNLMVYDSGQDALMMFGDVWGDVGSPQNDAKPYFFLYRYGPTNQRGPRAPKRPR